MAATPNANVTQAGVLAAVRMSAQQVRLPQSGAMAIYNIPSPEMRATSVGVNAVSEIVSEVDMTQAHILAVHLGYVNSPSVKAWGFTLDGHDFYVLKLGTSGKTLVFDLTTQQWSWWATKERASWRASTGINWRSAGTVPSRYGSNIIVGDDSNGALWVLDPERSTDDGLIEGTSSSFDRVATAQMVVKGKQVSPIYSVYLSCSPGEANLDNEVKLEYSDDQGRTFVTATLPHVVNGNVNQEYEWRSLGLVRAPGRLFRITDKGTLSRIDGLNINEE